MNFEWDPIKNSQNQKKHGVSFEEASLIWEGVHLEVKNIAYSTEEEIRHATMGWIREIIYVAIWTKRGNKIRLISVRRASKNEEKVFFKKIQDDPGNG
ncbi:MAG: BrnT family toxin [Deltaproteobacteria bacterium]|nr:BrnT family toxin [Deltaproteobacteria bacterium]